MIQGERLKIQENDTVGSSLLYGRWLNILEVDR